MGSFVILYISSNQETRTKRVSTEENNWWMSYTRLSFVFVCVCTCSPFIKYSSITASCLTRRIPYKDKRHVCSDLNVSCERQKLEEIVTIKVARELNLKQLNLNACCVCLPQRIDQSATVLQKGSMFYNNSPYVIGDITWSDHKALLLGFVSPRFKREVFWSALEAISAITSLNNITLTLKTRAGFLILVSAENKLCINHV